MIMFMNMMGRPGFIPGPAGRGPGAEAVEVAYPRVGLYVNDELCGAGPVEVAYLLRQGRDRRLPGTFLRKFYFRRRGGRENGVKITLDAQGRGLNMYSTKNIYIYI